MASVSTKCLFLLLLVSVFAGLRGRAGGGAGHRSGRHLVYFRDKTGTPFSVTQPQAFLSARALARRTRQGIAVLPRDLPVNASLRNAASRRERQPAGAVHLALVQCRRGFLRFGHAGPHHGAGPGAQRGHAQP